MNASKDHWVSVDIKMIDKKVFRNINKSFTVVFDDRKKSEEPRYFLSSRKMRGFKQKLFEHQNGTIFSILDGGFLLEIKFPRHPRSDKKYKLSIQTGRLDKNIKKVWSDLKLLIEGTIKYTVDDIPKEQEDEIIGKVRELTESLNVKKISILEYKDY
jgi:hypothetical protein